MDTTISQDSVDLVLKSILADIQNSQIEAALAKIKSALREKPTEIRYKTCFFELLCFQGDYERAKLQLKSIEKIDPSFNPGVIAYEELLALEFERRKVFSGESRPKLLQSSPPLFLSKTLESLQSKQYDQLVECEKLRPAVSVVINGVAYDDFRDSDDVLAGVLEVFINHGYFWIPLDTIKSITITPPTTLHHLLWAEVVIQTDLVKVQAYVPALYSGSEKHSPPLKFGNATDWFQLKPGSEFPVRGIGRRLYFLGDEDRSIFELDTICFQSKDDTAEIETEN